MKTKVYYYFLAIIILMLSSCSEKSIPQKWKSMNVPEKNLVKVTDQSDNNLFDAYYNFKSPQELIDQTSKWLETQGYQKVATTTITKDTLPIFGFDNGKEKLAFKIDLSGENQILSVFTEKGNSMLHGVCFGKYKIGKIIEGDEAKKMFLNELEK